MLIMAIEVEDRLEGLLILDNRSRLDAFAQRDTDLLQRLRGHILSAFIKTRLLSELKDLHDKSREVLRIAAHDFRSPFASMMSFLHLIRTRLVKGSLETRATIDTIDRQLAVGRAAIDLLERLLDLSAIESGTWELRPSSVDLTRIVREAEAQHRSVAADKEIELGIELGSGIPEIEADPALIRQVLDNLVSNAIKYTFPGGRVNIVCEAVNGRVVTSVRDTGQGLTEEDLEQVFRSFKKLSARPTAGESSTGIGLAIAKNLVEMHGGRIWVESTKGRGATFTFSLPMVPGCHSSNR
jgi:signal transduction histidine kinase